MWEDQRFVDLEDEPAEEDEAEGARRMNSSSGIVEG